MLLTDAVCVKLLNKSELVAGIGNRLHYFNEKTFEACSTSTRNKIKDLRVKELNNGCLEVLGIAGQEILYVKVNQGKFAEPTILKLNDWINCAQFSKTGLFFCATAHNHLAEMDHYHHHCLRRSKCDDFSTAYSSFIHGHTWESLIVFSGTAFGDLLIWNAAGGRLRHIPNAHSGVIFNVDLHDTLLTTTSDDRSVQIWTWKADVQDAVKVKQCFGHTARVFRAKITADRIISVGEDSKLCVWSHDGKLLGKSQFRSGTIWGVDFCPDTQTAFCSFSNGSLAKVSLERHLVCRNLPIHAIKVKFMDDILVILTHENQLIFQRGEEVLQQIDVGSIKISCMATNQQKTFLVTTQGSLHVYSLHANPQTFQISSSLIRSLICLPKHVLCCTQSGEISLLSLETFKISHKFQIPKCAEPWSTGACIVDDFLYVGDRCGNLHQFTLSSGTLLKSFKKLHGNLGITTIRATGVNSVETTGHDGTIKTILDGVHIFTVKVPVHWIEKRENSLIFGFNDCHFVCYNEEVVFEHVCGGGHRHWDVKLDGEGRAMLAYIQHKRLKLVEFDLGAAKSKIQVPRSRWHINACNVLVNVGDWMISGSEDNFLKIHSSEFNFIAESSQHISSIKDISTMSYPRSNSLLVFSVGGRAQICCTRISSTNIINDTSNFMLFKSDDVRRRSGKCQEVLYDPETRFTCCLLYDPTTLVCGCSDGFIRYFSIDPATCDITPHLEVPYGRCILRIGKIGKYILTMATDGKISFWEFEQNEPALQTQHNRNGINCFDVFPMESKQGYLVATGGDDQAIFVSQIEISDQIEVKRTKEVNIHIGQVTGLKFLDAGTLVSSGVDQMVYKFKWEQGLVVDEVLTGVADVKGLIVRGTDVVLYGNGVERIKLL